MYSPQVIAAQQRCRELQAQLKDAKRQLIEATAVDAGIKLGDWVRTQRGVFEVTRMDCAVDIPIIALHGRMVLRDGSLGRVEQFIWNWVKVDADAV